MLSNLAARAVRMELGETSQRRTRGAICSDS
jgi:hypothetical protein